MSKYQLPSLTILNIPQIPCSMLCSYLEESQIWRPPHPEDRLWKQPSDPWYPSCTRQFTQYRIDMHTQIWQVMILRTIYIYIDFVTISWGNLTPLALSLRLFSHSNLRRIRLSPLTILVYSETYKCMKYIKNHLHIYIYIYIKFAPLLSHWL
jgi:hypothetical protein